MNNLNPLYEVRGFNSLMYGLGRSTERVGNAVGGSGLVSFATSFPIAVLFRNHPEVASTMLAGGIGSMVTGAGIAKTGTVLKMNALYKDMIKKYGPEKAEKMILRHFRKPQPKKAISSYGSSSDAAIGAASAVAAM